MLVGIKEDMFEDICNIVYLALVVLQLLDLSRAGVWANNYPIVGSVKCRSQAQEPSEIVGHLHLTWLEHAYAP